MYFHINQKNHSSDTQFRQITVQTNRNLDKNYTTHKITDR